VNAAGCNSADVHAVTVTLLPRCFETIVSTPVTIVAPITIAPITVIAIPVITISPLGLSCSTGDCGKTKNQEECQNISAHFTRVILFHVYYLPFETVLATAMPQAESRFSRDLEGIFGHDFVRG
jgi:hypothetical protein